MKKLFVLFLAVSFLMVLALPVVAIHDGTIHSTEPPAGKTLPKGPQAGADLLLIVDTATNWIFAIFTVLTLIFILLAAFQFVTAGGDAEKVGEARQKLIWATVGIIIALASKGLVPVLRNILGAT